jgi:hypothetical protein
MPEMRALRKLDR